MELRRAALRALQLCDPAEKVAATRVLHPDLHPGLRTASDGAPGSEPPTALLDTQALLQPSGPLPGRPARPLLVPPAEVSRRSPFTAEGRAALLHAVAHIEFNAINLALDAVWRFAGLPTAFYVDWLRVAAEEAHHFSLLVEHLATLGCAYGDHPAHDGLWAMTERTAADPIARMALVPRTLEARGLDATPPMQERLRRAGDLRAVAILDVILRDEIGHVAVGNRWYHWLCRRDGLDAQAHDALLLQRYRAPQLKPPFNLAARRAAGFSEPEIEALGG
jgi:uncharacterized ferritin-like protein (DUF455 family)